MAVALVYYSLLFTRTPAPSLSICIIVIIKWRTNPKQFRSIQSCSVRTRFHCLTSKMVINASYLKNPHIHLLKANCRYKAVTLFRGVRKHHYFLINLKSLNSFGNCQRPVFSLGVSHFMHKIIKTCNNLNSIGRRSCDTIK